MDSKQDRILWFLNELKQTRNGSYLLNGVYVADVDATYKRALEAGATSVQAPVKKEDEDKRGGVKDAGGTTWWIATKVE